MQQEERFLVLTTTTDQVLANKMCARLEAAGIPVLLEHIEIQSGSELATGFRLLAPAKSSHVAMRLVYAATTGMSSVETVAAAA